MPRDLEPGSLCAKISATSAQVPLLIQTFCPFNTQSLPTCLALVAILPASEPALGSVRPKQPIALPLHRLGRYFCFCSSVPHFKMVNSTSDICTESVVRTLESP